jgi:hypothetical protein
MTPMPGGVESERNGRTCTAGGMFATTWENRQLDAASQVRDTVAERPVAPAERNDHGTNDVGGQCQLTWRPAEHAGRHTLESSQDPARTTCAITPVAAMRNRCST